MRVLRISESLWLNASPDAVWRVIDIRYGRVEQQRQLQWDARFLLMKVRYVLRVEAEASHLSTAGVDSLPDSHHPTAKAESGTGAKVTFTAELEGWRAHIASWRWFSERLGQSMRSSMEQLRGVGEVEQVSV